MLNFKDLNIGFAKTKKTEAVKLFDAANLKFEAGDFVAVIGPNGSGKTTLFNTILGQLTPLKGEICFEEKNWSALSRTEKAKHLSFVPSKFEGIQHLTVFDLIAMGRAPYTNLLNKLSSEDLSVVEKVLDQLNLSKYKYKNTLNLSDGERQIAMIGKALAQESEIMILDEPTAFLDYNNRRKVLKLLQHIVEVNNQLVFISSHDLELCFGYCNRIIAIDTRKNELVNFNAPFDKELIIKKVFE
ncbi:ABC transporter ATP-binding protein [Brumimicrobium aurantiacum]|nr:ABC transporter ATP-binding protein [Brumimicrobium aurantiacum]